MIDGGSMAARKSTLYLLYIHRHSGLRGIICVKGEASARCLADSPRLHSAPNREKKMRSGIEDWWVSPLLRAK
ncbi:hypothetical protein QR685DRAFT_571523 [Neurospora intermedia]|uniref:Uncharacterized protein n=1 Tax=Neurospora intermedia TaxID=5142 RepID=A0ABR3DCL0_NEUIN